MQVSGQDEFNIGHTAVVMTMVMSSEIQEAIQSIELKLRKVSAGCKQKTVSHLVLLAGKTTNVNGSRLQGFSTVSEAEVDVSWNSFAF